jgi:hypothetical protein
VEAGATQSFLVTLDSKPTAAVNVTLALAPSLARGPQVLLSTVSSAAAPAAATSMTFQPWDWSVPQTLVASAFDDDEFEGLRASTVDYSKLVLQPVVERIVPVLASADRGYNAIAVGTNEPDGQAVGYVSKQGVEVQVVDDDGGCPAEYICQNGGSCRKTARGSTASICQCLKGFGLRDCAARCELFGGCGFTRFRAILGCEEGGICGADGVFSARSLAGLLRTQLNTAPAVMAGNHSLGDVNRSMYVLSWNTTACLFSKNAVCVDVEFDIQDPSLTVGAAFLAMERAQELSDGPFYIKFAGQVDTMDRATTGKMVAWAFIGFVLLVMLCILCQMPIKRCCRHCFPRCCRAKKPREQ